MSWRVVFARRAVKDAQLVKEAGVESKVRPLLELLKDDPFITPPRYEKLVGDLAGANSRRITIQHRLVYEVLEADHCVKVLRMWSHYG